MAELPKWRKPVFLCSHWGVGGLKIGSESFHKFLIKNPMVAGYIHGHDHIWRKGMVHESFTSPRILKTLCLPSTGHWGDIGFALMRVTGGRAKVSLHQHDFYFPRPDPQEPGENRELWRLNTEDNQGLACTLYCQIDLASRPAPSHAGAAAIVAAEMVGPARRAGRHHVGRASVPSVRRETTHRS